MQTYDGEEAQLHAPAALFPTKEPWTHWQGGWMGPRVRVNVLAKGNVSQDVPGSGTDAESSR
jgi:hypothetical protein